MTEFKDRASLEAGSEPGFDLACVPCNNAGKHVEAEGYCTDCCEHLCGQCLNYHRTLSAVKHHKLTDKYSMPMNQTGPLANVICTERCKTHKGKVIEYFCPKHNILGCSVCMTLNHSRCKEVAYIPKISADLEQSQEYKIFKQRLDWMVRKSDVIIKSSKEKLDQSAYMYTKFQQDISAFRNEINTALDQLENDLKVKCEQIHSQNIDTMETVSSKVTQNRNELQAISSDFQDLLSSKLYCQAFTKMKTIDISPLQIQLNDIEYMSISNFTFKRSAELLQFLKGNDVLGKLLVLNPRELKAVFMTDINIRTKQNQKKSFITGIAQLSTDKLVITDCANDTIKLIDTVHNKVAFELKLEKYPWTVTTIDKYKVAVTLPQKHQILFLRCKDRFVIDAKIDVNGECRGIAYYQEKLFVIFPNANKMEILSMTGDVLQSYHDDDEGNQLFISPQYVSVHIDGLSMFVSDQGNHSLIKLSMDGKIQTVYKDVELRRPSQCVIDETGLVYLCGEYSHNVHLLTTECSKIKTILTPSDGLRCPRSICYCEATRKFYIGQYNNDTIKAFHLNA